jgi:hypothetical protein
VLERENGKGVHPMTDQPPIVFAVARALCEADHGNPDRMVSDCQCLGRWPAWKDYVRPARAALERTAIMLRGWPYLNGDAAAYITDELSKD